MISLLFFLCYVFVAYLFSSLHACCGGLGVFVAAIVSGE